MNRRLLLYSLHVLLLLICPIVLKAQTADFTISPASGCAPLVVSFTDASTGVVSSYSWNLGNSVTSTQQHPSTTYSTPGVYTVTLTVTGPAGTDTKTQTVTIYDQPAVSFTASGPLAGCAPHYVQFNSTVTPNSPGTATYSWDFGDGTTGTGPNPDHTYSTPGTYSVLLTVTNGAGCSNTFVQNAYITAHPVPTAGFSASQSYFCSAPATATFTNTSVGGSAPYTVNWDFGDGGKATGGTVTHTYTTGGTYTVTMIVADSKGCADTLVNSSYITVIGTLPTFTAPAAVCQLVPATFTNMTTGYSSTSWNFGDGLVDLTSNMAQHAYVAAGTYTVTMTTVVAGCTKTLSKTIQIDPKPTSTVTMTPPIPCPPPVTVSFSANSIVPTTTGYDWSWLSGGTASGQTVNKFYPNLSPPYRHDAVTLITTSAAGCKDTIRIDTVYIRSILLGVLPGASVCSQDTARGCFPLTHMFSTEKLKSALPPPPPGGCNPPDYPYEPSTWFWNFGDGSPPSTAATPTHTFAAAGDYRVSVVITTPNGCTDSGYTLVHTDTPVRPSLTASPLSVCQNSPIIYTNTTANILSGTKFSLTVAAPISRETDTTVRRLDSMRYYSMIRKPGSYDIFFYSDHRGCFDTFFQYNYLTVNPPDANFTDSALCVPFSTTVKFANTSVGSDSQFWLFGDGDTSSAPNPTHTYPGLGHYFVTLVVHNSTFGCYDTLVRRIQLFVPSFDFVATDTSICANEAIGVQATYYGYDTPSFSYYSDGKLTTFDTIGQAVFRYPTRGQYDITLYLSYGKGCFDTLTKPGYIVVSMPDVKYSVTPAIGCMPMTVSFVDSSTNIPVVPNVEWFWDFGDGDTLRSNLSAVSHTYTAVGRDTVHLLVTDSNGCQSEWITGFRYLSVHKPKAAFTVNDTTVCTFDLVVLTDTSASARHLQHLWNFGDGSTSTSDTGRHRYTIPGTYRPSLIVTDTVGCTDTLGNISVQVNAPSAAFTMSDSIGICPPLLIRFNNQSTAASTYRWDFGTGGSPAVVTNPISTFNTPGVYTVSLVARDGFGCTDTATAQVRVLGYSGAFSYTPLDGCVPMQVNFTTTLANIPQITWDFGDGVTSTGASMTATHTYLNAGAYLPKVIFSDGASCVSSSLGLDTIHADQVTADFSWSVPCAGTAFTLADSSSAVYSAPASWFWTFGGTADTATGSPVSYTFPTAGNHSVTMVAGNATGCKDTVTRNVFVNNLPLINVTKDTGVCPGDRVDLQATGGLSYTWSPAPDSLKNCPVCDIAFVHLDATAPGVFAIYTVTGKDANGCVNTDSTKVFIQLKTTSSIGPGGEICVGDSFRLHAAGAHRYEWSPAESLDSPFIASPLAKPQKTTTYVVAAQEGTCLIDSQYVQVVVHSKPLFSAGNDETIGLGSAVTLQPTKSGIVRIEWQPDTTLTCWNCFDPAAHPYYTRTYYATGYNEFGCWATDSVTVHVRCNTSLVFIPNTFTPNGDGKNDYFFPRGEGVERMTSFRIFNRWGELLFERSSIALNDERAGWDGTFKGRQLPPDTYVYTMQSTCRTGEVLQWKGDITLMR